MRTNSSTRTGAAIMLSMILIAAIAGVAASLSSLTIGNQRLRDERWTRLELVYAAESAANIALAEFQNNWSSYASQFEGQAIGTQITVPVATYVGAAGVNNDAITATITSYTDTGSSLAADEMVYRIETIATNGSTTTPETYRRRRVEMLVYPDETETFTHAMFAYNGYEFKGAATTDSWDSRLGDWIMGVSTGNGDLGSEGTVNVAKPGNVDGTAHSNVEAPAFTFDYSAELAAAGAVTNVGAITNNYTASNGSSPYLMSELDIGNGKTLTVQGAVEIFLDGPLTLNKGTIAFDLGTDPNSSLVIYQNDFAGVNTMSINGNSTVGAIVDHGGGTMTVEPWRLIIITEADGDVKLNGNGDFAGVIYSPNITYQLNGTFDFFGAVIAKAFGTDTGMGRVNGTFNFHYDDALNDLGLGMVPRLLISGWRASDLSYNQ